MGRFHNCWSRRQIRDEPGLVLTRIGGHIFRFSLWHNGAKRVMFLPDTWCPFGKAA
jgi:hypothetical protein